MKRFEYFYVYDTCGSYSTGHKNRGSQMIHIGNGRITFFACSAPDIIEADRQLAAFLNLSKINWNDHPFTQVVTSVDPVMPPLS